MIKWNVPQKVGKAAVAAGLVCTWDQPPAHADTYLFEGSIAPSQTLSQVYFVFATGACNSAVYTHKIADSIAGGVSTPVSFQMEMDPAERGRSQGEPYGEFQTIFALYDDASDGVTIGYNTTAASKVLAQSPVPEWTGTSIPAYFSDSDSVGLVDIGYTESQIASRLRDPSGFSVDGFNMFWDFPVLYPPRFANRPYDPDFSLLNFSPARPGGSASIAEVVPEPTAISVMGAGVWFVTLLRKRRT